MITNKAYSTGYRKDEPKQEPQKPKYPFNRTAVLFLALILCLFIVFIDQFLKWVVLEHIIRKNLDLANVVLDFAHPMSFADWLANAPERLPFFTENILPFFNITMVWNEGVSFGLLASDSEMGRYLLSAMALGISAVLVYMMSRSHSKLEIFAMATVVGGAIGNVIDRFRFGAVADFLDVHAYGFHFPVFNVADAAITIGIAFVVIYGLFLSPDLTHDEGVTH